MNDFYAFWKMYGGSIFAVCYILILIFVMRKNHLIWKENRKLYDLLKTTLDDYFNLIMAVRRDRLQRESKESEGIEGKRVESN